METNSPIPDVPSHGRLPVSRHDYTIVTPMMKDLFDIVSNDVAHMESGISICTSPRAGKTRALNYVTRQLELSTPSITVKRMVMSTQSFDTDQKFFSRLLLDCLGANNTINNERDFRSTLERHLLSQCADRGDPRLLLIIDEAQRIKASHYSFLIDLTNHLELLQLAPTVLLMGQSELMKVRDELASQGRHDVLGRFFDNPIIFETTCTREALAAILSQYDEYKACAFPAGSKKCITENYVPKLYRAGFRIEIHGAFLWDAAVSIADSMNTKPSLGMKIITRAVETALTRLILSDDMDKSSGQDWWIGILKRIGYPHYLKYAGERSA